MKWKLRHIAEEATIEVAFLFQNPDVEVEIKRILKILMTQDDPRQPDPISGLDVSELVDDAPGWFRVKVPRYGIRIVFRLMVVRGERGIELKRLQRVPENFENYYIDITQAGYRKNVYGEELRRRYRRLRGE